MQWRHCTLNVQLEISFPWGESYDGSLLLSDHLSFLCFPSPHAHAHFLAGAFPVGRPRRKHTHPHWPTLHTRSFSTSTDAMSVTLEVWFVGIPPITKSNTGETVWILAGLCENGTLAERPGWLRNSECKICDALRYGAVLSCLKSFLSVYS